MKYFAALLVAAASAGQIFEDQEMWTLSMDNEKFKEVARDDREIGQDWEAFIKNHKRVHDELNDLGQDLHHEFEDIGSRLHETGKMLSNPKYKAELEAIGKKMQTLDQHMHKHMKFDDEGLKMWKLHMDNDEYKEAARQDREIGQDMEKFVKAHKKVQAELKDLGQDLHKEFVEIGQRLEKTGKLLSEPKYQKELAEIDAKMKALDRKVKRNLKWDDEGLEMWKLHMNNKKFKEVHAEREQTGKDIEKFIKTHKKIQAGLKDLGEDIKDDLEDMGERLEETGKFLDNHPNKGQLDKIMKRYKANNDKFGKHLKFDDEGLEMWTLSMDNEQYKKHVKIDNEINEDAARFIKKNKDIENEFKDMLHDLGEELQDIGEELEEFGEILDDPKYKAELQAIGKGIKKTNHKIKRNLKFDDEGLKMWKLSMDNDKTKEIHAEREQTGKDIEKFVKSHKKVQAGLKKLGDDVKGDFEAIGERLEHTGKFLDNHKNKDEFDALMKRYKANNDKFGRNLKFDDEGLEMWTLSMDNDKYMETVKTDNEINEDMVQWIKKNEDAEAEFKDMIQDVGEEFEDIGEDLKVFGKTLDDPKYKAELEAIAEDIEKTNRKAERHIKFDDEGLKMWKLHMNNKKFKEVHAERQASKKQIKKFFKTHEEANEALHDMFEDVGDDLEDIGDRLGETGKVLSKPKYQKRLQVIGNKIEATNKKIHRHMKFDDEGLDMWTLSMDNQKFKEVHAERQQQGEMLKKFVHNNKEVHAELKDLAKDVGEELRDIGEELEEFGNVMEKPKYRKELKSIARGIKKTDRKIKRHLKFDDEGLKM